MSKQFLPFRAPVAQRTTPSSSHQARKAWLRLSRDVTLRFRGASTQRRAVLIALAVLLLFLPFRLALIARSGRHTYGALSLRATSCSCPTPSTPGLFAADVLSRARFVASATFLRYERRAIVLRVDELFRGPLRAVQYDIVVADGDAAACFLGAPHRNGQRDRWLVVGAGISAYETKTASGDAKVVNRSRVLPGWLDGPGCPRLRHRRVTKDKERRNPIVWFAPWVLVSNEVIEGIRVDAGDGELWWRRKHAWEEFATAVRHTGNESLLLDHDHHFPAKSNHEQVRHVESQEVQAPTDEEWWLRDGVSLVAACKDRSMTLSKAIRSWTQVRGIDEILLVDWSSDPPVSDSLSEELLGNKKITLVRVNGQNDWVLSRAYNLAARLASFTKLMKVDCDTNLHADFFEAHPLTTDKFFAGDWRQLESGAGNELHVNGLLFVNRDDFLAVGGYDERITTYGWDDSDVAERLSRIRKAQRFDYNKVQHIAHPASLRVVNQHHQSLLPPDNPHAAAVEIQRNRLLLTHFHVPEWRVTSLHTLWNTARMTFDESKSKRRLSSSIGAAFSLSAANEITSVSSLVSDADALDVGKRAVRLILHRYGVQLLPKSLTLDFYKELITKVAFPENYAEVVLSFRGGCASRLLAYAASNQATTGARLKDSSSEIADSSYVWPPLPYRGWRLQGLWKYPDNECSCKFSNVFDAQEEEIISAWVDKDNPIRTYQAVSDRQPSEDVTAILKSFDSRAKEKVISDELKRWTKKSLRHGKNFKARILADDIACDLDPKTLPTHRRDLIRAQFRKLVPSKQIQETIVASLNKRTASILDSECLVQGQWPILVGSAYAAAVSERFESPSIRRMLPLWGADGVEGETTYRLDQRAGSLTIAIHVSENGVRVPARLTHAQSIELNHTVATITRRVERLFIGCSSPPSNYLEAYPELAFVLAGFLSCGTCV